MVEPDRVLKGFRVLLTRSRDGELHSMAPGMSPASSLLSYALQAVVTVLYSNNSALEKLMSGLMLGK